MIELEKKAEENVKRNVCGYCNKCQSHGYIGCDIYKYSRDSFIAGAKENNIVWHKQSDTDDIYDACNDWYLHCFVCKMKDGSYNIAFGTCDEDNNGIVSIDIWFEHEDSKYYVDDIIAWYEMPRWGN